MGLPRNLLEGAEQRYGLIDLKAVRDAGVSRAVLEHALQTGRLQRMHEGVFRVTGAAETWLQQELAACLATEGIASHRAALRLWGIDLGIDIPTEITVTRPHAPRPKGVVIHRSLDLDPDEAVTRADVPVTDPVRMVVDLGAVTGAYWVSRALERCVVAKLLTVKAARAELDRLAKRGRRGAGVLRKVLEDWPLGDVRPDSVLEAAFGRLVRAHELPAPVFQHELIAGGRRRRIDFAYPSHMVAIEVDGFACRTDRRVFQDERWRQNDLVRLGWRVVRFTWHDVLYRPEYVATTVLSLLGKQTPNSSTSAFQERATGGGRSWGVAAGSGVAAQVGGGGRIEGV